MDLPPIRPRRADYGLKAFASYKACDPEGRVVGRVDKGLDTITANFAKTLLAQVIVGRGYISTTIKRENGTSYTHDWWDFRNRKIAIGTGTTPPTVDDYALESKVAETDAVSRKDLDNGVELSATIYLNEAYTISECGYFLFEYSANNWILLARDVFEGISVPAGGSFVVAYKFLVG